MSELPLVFLSHSNSFNFYFKLYKLAGDRSYTATLFMVSREKKLHTANA